MSGEERTIWVYLTASPLLHLTLTVVAYAGADWLYRRSGRKALFNPVLIAVIVLVTLLTTTGIPYSRYFEGAQFVHFLLGPATVALAVPLFRQFHLIRRSWLAIAVAVLFGSSMAVVSAVGLGWVMGASREALISLAPKSVTTPVAMGIAEKLGGLPSLTAVLVILTGILGAVLGSALLRLVRIRDPRAVGLAIGVASHGIGTARALQLGELTGAFAAMAMGLNALATAVLVPLLFRLLG
ncbi:MAG: LrgB family protein [Proteobacteria bacterium]|nr:MAG: LrgB family protein [Pseudomonadota bacterium]